jgi:hypothetical protein
MTGFPEADAVPFRLVTLAADLPPVDEVERVAARARRLHDRHNLDPTRHAGVAGPLPSPTLPVDAGSIRHRIRDHDTRFPADTAERAADRIVRAVRDPDLWRRIGAAARESKCRDVIPTRPAEDRFDLPASLQASCRFPPGRS